MAARIGASDAGVEVSEGVGPVGVGAQGRARERRAQPRQVARRHRLRRPAPRQRQHARTSRARRSSRRCARPTTSRASPPKTRRPACPTPTTWPRRPRRRATSTCSIPGTSTPQAAAELALRCEEAALATDRRITNSEGAGVSAQQSHFWAGNTRGFRGGYASSRHSLSVSPIAGKGATACSATPGTARCATPRDLAAPEAVGRYAAERALSRLKSRKVATCEVPVLFESPLAAGLLGAFVQATSGGSLYRKASFLLDSLGQQAIAARARRPATKTRTSSRGKGSAPFDDEGVRTQRARRGRGRRGAGLLPVELLGAQARHEDHRPRRRLAEPDADAAA